MATTTTTTAVVSSADLPKPSKIVTYPIGSETDENGAALYIFGDPSKAKNLILMCAGYPDDHENFLPFASRLCEGTSSLVGVTCLPGYDDRPEDGRPYTSHNPDGYSFQEMAHSLRDAAKILKKESSRAGGDAKIIGIFHDWGVVPGLMWANQAIEEGDDPKSDSNKPDRIVLFDVLVGLHPDDKAKKAPPGVPNDTIREIITGLSYRAVLASCFVVRRYVSKVLAQVMFGAGFGFLNAIKLAPTLEIDSRAMEKRVNPISLDRLVYMAYPYYYMFKAMFGGAERMQRDFRGLYLPRNLQRLPVLYLYGLQKRIMFHDKTAVAVLEKEHEDGNDRSCNAIAVPDAGHWLYLQQPDTCFDYVSNFVKDA